MRYWKCKDEINHYKYNMIKYDLELIERNKQRYHLSTDDQ